MSLSNATYDIAAERAEQSYEAWLETIPAYDVIAEELAAEMCDMHSMLRPRREYLAAMLLNVLNQLYNDESVGELGAELETNLTLEHFRRNEELEPRHER